MKRLIAIILILIGPLLFCRQTETQNNQSLPYWCRPQSNWFKHVGLVAGRYILTNIGLIKPEGLPFPHFYSDSIPQSISDGRFLGKYRIVSVASDSTELLPVLNFPEIFAEKRRYYDVMKDKIVTQEDRFIIVMPFVEEGDSIHFYCRTRQYEQGVDCSPGIYYAAYYKGLGKFRALVYDFPGDFEQSKDTLQFVFRYETSETWSDRGYIKQKWNNSTVLTIAKDKSFVPEQ